MNLAELPAEFRAKAADVRMNAAAEQAAYVWERAADRLEEVLRAHSLEPLTLAEAAIESGYSRDHLRRQIREGRIPNAGEPGAPLLLRCHLPRKPGHRVAATAATTTSSRTQAARAVAKRED